MLGRALGTAVVASALSVACDREAVSNDDASLAQTVASLRDAPNPEKRPWLQRLEASRCTTPTACRLRDICSQAYRAHDRALEGARAAKHAIQGDTAATGTGALSASQTTPEANAVEQSARLVLQAEQSLLQARKATQECAALELQWRNKGR